MNFTLFLLNFIFCSGFSLTIIHFLDFKQMEFHNLSFFEVDYDNEFEIATANFCIHFNKTTFDLEQVKGLLLVIIAFNLDAV